MVLGHDGGTQEAAERRERGEIREGQSREGVRCELGRAVYDCSNCGHREYQEIGDTYLAEVACENQPCHEDTPRRPDTFPSTARLVGFHCPVHGCRLPLHLRQRGLF